MNASATCSRSAMRVTHARDRGLHSDSLPVQPRVTRAGRVQRQRRQPARHDWSDGFEVSRRATGDGRLQDRRSISSTTSRSASPLSRSLAHARAAWRRASRSIRSTRHAGMSGPIGGDHARWPPRGRRPSSHDTQLRHRSTAFGMRVQAQLPGHVRDHRQAGARARRLLAARASVVGSRRSSRSHCQARDPGSGCTCRS